MKYFTLLCLLLMLVGCSSSYERKEINEGIQQYQKNEEALLIDVRIKAEYLNGHIEEAILLPLDEIDQNAAQVLNDKNQVIFVYCRSGNRSQQAAQKLVDLGYTHIIEIGGIIDYVGEIVKGEDLWNLMKSLKKNV